jgi:hypothetical protein
MKRKMIFLLCFQILICSTLFLYSDETEKLLLNSIIENINNYKNKTLTIKLRFKNIDTNFDKIVFYDKKNNDIIFDIAELKKTITFKKQKLNLHEGLEYLVTFTVKDLTDRNNLIGELKNFQPDILTKLPF